MSSVLSSRADQVSSLVGQPVWPVNKGPGSFHLSVSQAGLSARWLDRPLGRFSRHLHSFQGLGRAVVLVESCAVFKGREELLGRFSRQLHGFHGLWGRPARLNRTWEPLGAKPRRQFLLIYIYIYIYIPVYIYIY